MRRIEADGLTLEPQVAAHAPAMFVVLSDPAIYEYENQPPRSEAWLFERFTRLETRRSADGRERWLNWVIRIPAGELIGYVQATVHPTGRADIAYILTSRYWGRGLATVAVRGMIAELALSYGVTTLSAELKRLNLRSLRLLERLGFTPATPEEHAVRGVPVDELLMERAVTDPR